MRIAYLTSSVSRQAGGLLPVLRRLAAEQAAVNGGSIRVFALEDRFTAADRPEWNGVVVRTVIGRGPAAFGYAPGLVDSIEDAGPDLVHCHGIWMYPSVACLRWAKRTGRPYVVSPHGMLDAWALRNSAWKKRLAGWLYENAHLRRAACLHALCEAEARAFRAYGLKNPICVIPNGVDPPETLEASAPDWEDEDLQGARVLLYLGRLHPKKNLLNLLRAWAAIQREAAFAKRWRLIICGWDQGGYEGRLKEAAREFGVEATVRFPGPQFGEAKHAAFCRADAFVLSLIHI